jgi:nicotinamide mononucleotide (NMN) deamidase PncC
MITQELVPWLREKFGARPLGANMTLRFVGVGQSQIDQTLKDHVSIARDVTVTSLFEASRVDFTFTLPGNTAADKAMLAQLKEDVLEHLGEYFYAADGSTLEQVVAEQLVRKGGKLVLAEIGSGGQLGATIAGVPGIERLLTGVYEAPTETALRKLLGLQEAANNDMPDRLKTLAGAAAERTGSDWAIAVGPLEPGQGGSKTVRVAFRHPGERIELRQFAIRESPDARSHLVTQILDSLRRQLQ